MFTNEISKLGLAYGQKPNNYKTAQNGKCTSL